MYLFLETIAILRVHKGLFSLVNCVSSSSLVIKYLSLNYKEKNTIYHTMTMFMS